MISVTSVCVFLCTSGIMPNYDLALYKNNHLTKMKHQVSIRDNVVVLNFLCRLVIEKSKD